MANEKIVVALGGNAILTDDPTADAQKSAVKKTVKKLIKFVKNGDKLIVSHGNGPQVGNLLLQQSNSDSKENPAMPLDTAVAMTQGQIGYWIQNAFDEVLADEKIDKKSASVVTQIVVDKDDSAFKDPSKPIGPFYSEEESKEQQKKHPDATYKEDAGRGYRQVVPSPRPISIPEASVVNTLVENDVITISVGGGGIPVVKDGNKLTGVEAVVDKDFASEKLAEVTGADTLIILTGVDNVYVNYNKPDQKKLDNVTSDELQEYIDQDQFAAGSMLPKVQAAIEFVKNSPGNKAVITSLDNIDNYIENGSGTIISN